LDTLGKNLPLNIGAGRQIDPKYAVNFEPGGTSSHRFTDITALAQLWVTWTIHEKIMNSDDKWL